MSDATIKEVKQDWIVVDVHHAYGGLVTISVANNTQKKIDYIHVPQKCLSKMISDLSDVELEIARSGGVL